MKTGLVILGISYIIFLAFVIKVYLTYATAGKVVKILGEEVIAINRLLGAHNELIIDLAKKGKSLTVLVKEALTNHKEAVTSSVNRVDILYNEHNKLIDKYNETIVVIEHLIKEHNSLVQQLVDSNILKEAKNENQEIH